MATLATPPERTTLSARPWRTTTGPTKATGRSVKILRWLAVALIAVGVLGRLVRYFLPFPIWGDEAFVCFNLLHRDFAGLTHGLEYAQVAPILFLWGELATVRSAGVLGTRHAAFAAAGGTGVAGAVLATGPVHRPTAGRRDRGRPAGGRPLADLDGYVRQTVQRRSADGAGAARPGRGMAASAAAAALAGRAGAGGAGRAGRIVPGRVRGRGRQPRPLADGLALGLGRPRSVRRLQPPGGGDVPRHVLAGRPDAARPGGMAR